MSIPVSKVSVTYSQSRTINMGNYESTQVGMSCTLESGVPGSEQELYAQAADFVEEALNKEVETVSGQSLNHVTKNKAKKAEKPAPKEEAAEEAPAEEEKPKKKKPAAKKKKAEEPEDDGKAEVTHDMVRQALRDYSKEYSKDAAKAIIKDVAGVKKIDEIPEDKFSAVLIACESAPEEDEEDDE